MHCLLAQTDDRNLLKNRQQCSVILFGHGWMTKDMWAAKNTCILSNSSFPTTCSSNSITCLPYCQHGMFGSIHKDRVRQWSQHTSMLALANKSPLCTISTSNTTCSMHSLSTSDTVCTWLKNSWNGLRIMHRQCCAIRQQRQRHISPFSWSTSFLCLTAGMISLPSIPPVEFSSNICLKAPSLSVDRW